MSQLSKKLKLEGAQFISLLNAPACYSILLLPLSNEISVVKLFSRKVDQIHLFVRSINDLRKYLTISEKYLVEKGLLWIFYPKESSEIITDINRDSCRELISKLKWKQVGFVSIAETWTAFGLLNESKQRKIKVESDSFQYIDKNSRIVHVL